MERSHAITLNAFFNRLKEFRDEGMVYTTFRTNENAIAGIELKGFKSYKEATEFVSNQFTPEETPTVIELIDKVIQDFRQGKYNNREDLAILEPYLKKEIQNRIKTEDDALLSKCRDQEHRMKR